ALSKVFNDAWMADYGFLTSQTPEPRISDVLTSKRDQLPLFVHAHPDETVRAVIETLREYDVSQLPVLKEEPPVMAAEVVGSITERDLLDALASGRAAPGEPVSTHMSAPLPMIGSGEPISAAVAALEKAGAAAGVVHGKPARM